MACLPDRRIRRRRLTRYRSPGSVDRLPVREQVLNLTPRFMSFAHRPVAEFPTHARSGTSAPAGRIANPPQPQRGAPTLRSMRWRVITGWSNEPCPAGGTLSWPPASTVASSPSTGAAPRIALIPSHPTFPRPASSLTAHHPAAPTPIHPFQSAPYMPQYAAARAVPAPPPQRNAPRSEPRPNACTV